MKLFHISDVLTLTTTKLVSSRHMDGVYDILQFLTGRDVYTHQVPGAMKACEPYLRSQFPSLFPESADMKASLDDFEKSLDDFEKSLDVDGDDEASRAKLITDWVESVRLKMNLPQMLPLHEMHVDKRQVR